MQNQAPDPASIVSTQTPGQLFGRLWRGYLRKHAGWIAVAFILMVIEGSTLGLLSYMLQPMFDVVFVDGQSDMAFLVAIAIFGLFVIRAFSGLAQRVLMTRTSHMASTELQIDLLGHTLELDNGFHSRTSPGALIERVQGDVISIQSLWNVIITGAGRDLISLISLMVVAISIDWKWAAVAVIGAPILLLPSILVQRFIRKKSHYLREIAGKRTTRLDEIFHGITPIKLNRMESYQRGRFTRLSDDWVRSSVKTVAGQATVPGLVDLAVGFGFFCVLLYGGPEIASGEKTVGQFMSFFAAMSLAFQPLRRLADVAGYWQVMQASLARIFGLMDLKPEVKDIAGAGAPLPEDSTVTFDTVSLSYGDLPVLNALSLTVPKGTTTALVGQSGAGKSTVFNVLTRLIDAQTGTVKIGGTNITDLKLDDLRSMFSVVSQDALLFDETLRENILLGRTDVTDEELIHVLDAANVTNFLSNLPDGLDTEVGPRGSNLSGGQRQRVAIARALLKDTPILLLDEATSALDAESEQVVQTALDELSKGRTTLIIAHRLSTIRNADQIAVLDQGQLAEIGTHDALLEKGGIYANLHGLQSGSGIGMVKSAAPAAAAVTNEPAIAVLPYVIRPRFSFRNVPLDELDWPLGRPARLSTGTVADMEDFDHLLIYSRKQVYWQPRPHLQPKLSVMIVEPDAIHGKHLTLAKRFHHRFHRILTHSPTLLGHIPNALQLNPAATWLQTWPAQPAPKTHMASLIASSKRDFPGHVLRHDVVDLVREKQLDVDVMGRGYKPFDNKSDGLLPFRYSVVIENVQEPGYFTEKLIDAALCRTVPIYWGSPDVTEHFEADGMIICDSKADIERALAQMSAEDYASRNKSVEANFKTAEALANLHKRASSLILES
ncbi:MAG: ATP-binding cassette domain-containing protein [Pseudomonadota bacterium]